MKIMLLIFGLFSCRWCFVALSENPLALWLVPILFLLGIASALLGLKTFFDYLGK
jgi:hypothetical protein